MPRRIMKCCKICNGDYFGPNAYCSQECHDIGIKKQAPWNKGITGIPSKRKILHTCKHCQTTFYGKGSGRGMYCTEECRKSEGRPDVTNGRKGIEKTCPQCETSFYVHPSTIKQVYCSPKCLSQTTKQSRNCVICDAIFVTTQSKRQATCSKKCATELQSRIRQGEKSTFWRGGKMAPYVGIWKTQRRAARERDGYQCVLCGSTDRIQVHHIIPFRYSQSHDLTNLVTLCRSCHSREELKVNPVMREAFQRWKGHVKP
jgi:hypothetical protein